MLSTQELIKKANENYNLKPEGEYNKTSYLTGFYEGYLFAMKSGKKKKSITTIGRLMNVGIGK